MKKQIKRILTELSKRNIYIRKIVRKMFFYKRKVSYLKYFRKNEVNNKIIIFEAYMGRSYACSPKAIYEEMLMDEKYKDFEFVWAFKNKSDHQTIKNLESATIVKYGGKKYYEYYSKAKYWVTNSRLPEHIIKKPEQVYVQCWHGTPLKRLGYDILAETQNAMNTQEEMIEKYNSDAIRYSYMLSPSKFCTEKFTSAFNLNELHTTNIIIEEGYPRNDYLYNYKEEDITRIKEELGIPENKKIVLYAPTWRDNQHTSGVGYTYKTEADFDYLKEKLEDDYVILFRAHYFIANSFDFEKYEGFVYDVSKIDDINELYVISDILITDYSSVFFDYANLKRPMLFFMYDLEFYENKLRGFYIDLKELPGDIIKEEVDIVNIIKDINDYNKRHAKTYKVFNEKYNYLDDGQASKRVLTKIVNE
ncbi:MAG: CDP-glycerol glycerophosphotransferase family protein [Bacilli bacterium]|nr:CDP-glycerol glycerophosphotransferase family protein [Bacilli bacterium]